MDTLVSLQVFRQVVDAGSFALAAQALDLSTATVSKHVAHLENYLAARLLNRTTRKLSLTETGRAYYERCVQVLNDLQEAKDAIGDASVVPRGTLRVNALQSFGVRHIAPLIAEYTAQHPNVTIDLTLNDRVVDLVEEGYDLAIRAMGALKPSSLVARPLAKLHRIVCAAPTYLQRHPAPATAADLKAHNCLVWVYGASPREWQIGAAENAQRVSVRSNFLSNDGDAVRAAAIAGTGVAYLTSDIVGADLASGCLVQLLPGLQPAELGIYAVYPSRRHLSAKVRSLVDFLTAKFAVRPFL
jgi:DNA-binding transcriptional LysR family regulator